MIGRLRQPEYTGENRCIPCTVLNTMIAFGLTLGVWVVSAELAVVAFVLSASVIYFRGYLVPGTPELTQRYLPDRVLRLFHDDRPSTTPSPSSQDLGAVLDETGVITECEDAADVCLDDDFRIAWQEHVESIRADGSVRNRLFDYLAVDRSEVTFEELGANFEARLDGDSLGQWESEAALLADASAMAALNDGYDRWPALDDSQRFDVAKALRVFLDRCPDCDSPVTVSREQVEFCCEDDEETYAKIVCEDCEVRLLETQVNAIA